MILDAEYKETPLWTLVRLIWAWYLCISWASRGFHLWQSQLRKSIYPFQLEQDYDDGHHMSTSSPFPPAPLAWSQLSYWHGSFAMRWFDYGPQPFYHSYDFMCCFLLHSSLCDDLCIICILQHTVLFWSLNLLHFICINLLCIVSQKSKSPDLAISSYIKSSSRTGLINWSSWRDWSSWSRIAPIYANIKLDQVQSPNVKKIIFLNPNHANKR